MMSITRSFTIAEDLPPEHVPFSAPYGTLEMEDYLRALPGRMYLAFPLPKDIAPTGQGVLVCRDIDPHETGLVVIFDCMFASPNQDELLVLTEALVFNISRIPGNRSHVRAILRYRIYLTDVFHLILFRMVADMPELSKDLTSEFLDNLARVARLFNDETHLIDYEPSEVPPQADTTQKGRALGIIGKNPRHGEVLRLWMETSLTAEDIAKSQTVSLTPGTVYNLISSWRRDYPELEIPKKGKKH